MKANGVPAAEQFEAVIKELWDLPEREFQYMALVLLEKHVNKAEANHIELLEYVAVHKSWWDSIDMIAAHLMGAHFKRFPEQIEPITQRWMKSGNIWLQRCALLFQLKYKQTTDTERLYSYT